MRKVFEMSEQQFQKIIDACKPTPVMFLSGGQPMFDTPQENANHAWRELGKEMGFEYLTVQPISGKSQRFFSAVSAPVEGKEPRP